MVRLVDEQMAAHLHHPLLHLFGTSAGDRHRGDDDVAAPKVAIHLLWSPGAMLEGADHRVERPFPDDTSVLEHPQAQELVRNLVPKGRGGHDDQEPLG